MAHKEYGVTDILDVLRRNKAKDGIKRIDRATGMTKNTGQTGPQRPPDGGRRGKLPQKKAAKRPPCDKLATQAEQPCLGSQWS